VALNQLLLQRRIGPRLTALLDLPQQLGQLSSASRCAVGPAAIVCFRYSSRPVMTSTPA